MVGLIGGLWLTATHVFAATPPTDALGICGYRALLIAAQDYEHREFQDLATPHEDVRRIGALLEKKYGFAVETTHDPTRAELGELLERVRSARPCEALLVYYAGHGVRDEAGNEGYWVPVDALPNKHYTYVPNRDVVTAITASPARHVWLVTDSCFGARFLMRGIGRVAEVPADATLAQARRWAGDRSRWVTTSGADEPVADEGHDGSSLFAYHFHRELAAAKHRYIVPSDVYDEIARATAGQHPQEGSLAEANHTFGASFVLTNHEHLANQVYDEVTVPAGRVDGRPVGPFVMMRTEVTQLLWTTVMGQPTWNDQLTTKQRTPCDTYQGVSIEGEQKPAICVSWLEAVRFANALSKSDGLTEAYRIDDNEVRRVPGADGWRLPTDDEWEWAARGGTDQVYAGTSQEDEVCKFANVADREWNVGFDFASSQAFACDDGVAALADVGSFAPNGYGLEDMSGNVWEWVWSEADLGSSRQPWRGGGFNSAGGARKGAVEDRRLVKKRFKSRAVGVRLVRTVQKGRAR